MRTDYMFTSESVTEGHPDKLCDVISDAVIDHFLLRDPFSRIITECAVSTGVLFIAARFATSASVDIPEVARKVIQDVGYNDSDFNAKDCSIMTSFRELPKAEYHTNDERLLDDDALDKLTVRNQVTVFGFACDQTANLMPLPIVLAHKLARRMTEARKSGELGYLSPDGKTQVGIEYRNRQPYRIYSITLIASQKEHIGPSLNQLQKDMIKQVIDPVFEKEHIKPDKDTQIFVNPDGLLIGGGPSVHSGLTGRKNAIDMYGEFARRSGAALSGKDPTRIDRVGAYAARHIAKNVVAAGAADECEIQLSYSIGQARPVSIVVDTFGTGKIDDIEITRRIGMAFDLRLGGIIRDFELRFLPQRYNGFYQKLAAYGQVGREDMDMPWEKTDKTDVFMR
jgi:S-adenosylmethionine synthetase